MDKGLQLHRAAVGDFPHFGEGQLSGQHYPLHALFIEETGACGGVDAHLGGSVDGQLRRSFPNEPEQPRVLYQQGIHRQRAGEFEKFQRCGQFVVPQQGVDGEIDFHTPAMAVFHRLAELIVVEIFRRSPGAECAAPQIHRVGSGADSRFQRFRRTGRGEDFNRGGKGHEGLLSDRSW